MYQSVRNDQDRQTKQEMCSNYLPPLYLAYETNGRQMYGGNGELPISAIMESDINWGVIAPSAAVSRELTLATAKHSPFSV